MTRSKQIRFVVPPQAAHWVGDGFKVHNFIPSLRGLGMRDMDPFILLDYNAPMTVKPSDVPRGVGVHPHRGFETVTIAYRGSVEHHDSGGGGGVIREGDVQWMTAASGVLHKEYYEKEWNRTGGMFQMVQLWTNLPAKDKMREPKYQAIGHGDMGRHELADGKSLVEVIAGRYADVEGPAQTHSPIHMMNARLHRGATAEFSFPAHYNTLVLAIEGTLKVNGTEVPANHLLRFDNEGETFSVEAVGDTAIALVLSGEPLHEPIAAYGPFVMNHEAELKQAFADFNNGKFGYLED